MAKEVKDKTDCPTCNGHKQIWNPNIRLMEDCQHCKATGKIAVPKPDWHRISSRYDTPD